MSTLITGVSPAASASTTLHPLPRQREQIVLYPYGIHAWGAPTDQSSGARERLPGVRPLPAVVPLQCGGVRARPRPNHRGRGPHPAGWLTVVRPHPDTRRRTPDVAAPDKDARPLFSFPPKRRMIEIHAGAPAEKFAGSEDPVSHRRRSSLFSGS